MLVFDERDLEEQPWWVKEPAPKPEEGYKFVIRYPDLLAMIEDRRYRVRARRSLVSPQTLTLHLWLWMSEDRNYHDRIELYAPEERQGFIQGAAPECKVDAALIERDLGLIMRECERMRDDMLKDFAEQKDRSSATLQ